MPLPLLALAVTAALSSSFVACGTALASPKKPAINRWNKGRSGPGAKPVSMKQPAGPGPSGTGVPKTGGDGGPAKAAGPAGGFWADDRFGDETNEWRGKGKALHRPALPGDWPEWKFPHMGKMMEMERTYAEQIVSEGRMHGAAHAWDNLRALARQFLGPDDPRVWAALSRSARALADHATTEITRGLKDASNPKWPEYWEFRARGAVSMAAGAADALADPSLELCSDPMSGSGPLLNATSRWIGGRRLLTETDSDRARNLSAGAQPWDRDSELAFARETLKAIRGKTPSAASSPPPPAGSLAEAIYPGTLPEAKEDPCPSPAELRARLAAAEGPGGPGPGTREALVLRSLLGAELWDSGGDGLAAEAMELLEESSGGLESLAGRGDPDSLDAAERLARRLAGMYGYAAVLPQEPVFPYDENVERAAKLFLWLKKLAPSGQTGKPMRSRAKTYASVLSASEGKEDYAGPRPRQLKIPHSLVSMVDSLLSRPDLEGARVAFDLAEMLLRDENKDMAQHFHMGSLACRRRLLGGRHPETASTLARTGDMFYYDAKPDPFPMPFSFPGHEPGDERACSLWAQALEALEGRGERYEAFAGDLELRMGRAVLLERHYWTAAKLLVRAEGRLRRALGDADQATVECSVLAAHALWGTGDMAGAEEIYSRVIGLLDGAPPRSDPDPVRPSDEAALSVSLAGKGAALYLRGDRAAGGELIRRSAEMAGGIDIEDFDDNDMLALG
ncbi:MAG: tetratricopeptide repeat protein, partial [Deltaproteobacteria bacterium]|nr:tetratricopeptide repeat protein [Deltaproteobacteria bacterium]